MAEHLTDKQRKEIIADRTDGLSIRQLANKYHTSTTTIHRTLKSDPEMERKVTEKREENTADILAHMVKKRELVNQIIDEYLNALLDQEKISKANPVQLTTALGILIDKFTMAKGNKADDNKEEDDPLTKALKEEAERLDNGIT